MKLVTYLSGGAETLGAQVNGSAAILDLQRAHRLTQGRDHPAFASMQALIEAGEEGLDSARKFVALAPEEAVVPARETVLLSPLPRPVQMRDFLCFETHMRQAGLAVAKLRAMASAAPEAALREVECSGPPPIPPVWYQQPIYYKCNRFAVTGTGQEIAWPAYSRLIDYELEIAAVIGRTAKDVAPEKARDHIFGFTIFNDLTARDAQALEMSGPLGPAKGKDFDDANVLGPCIVTIDEIANPYDLTMTARVNGEIWTRGNTGTMHWTFEEMIAHVSRGETLHSGEVLGSGTVGNGCGLEQMRFLKHGDVVELEIERIGTIRNRILAPHCAR